MGVVAVALLLTPTQARAQFFYNPGFGYGGYGFGGFGNYRGFGGFGGFGNPYFGGYGSPYNSPYFGGSRPTVNSTTTPYVVNVMLPPMANQGLNSNATYAAFPNFPATNSYYPSQTPVGMWAARQIVPQPRMRSTLEPALPISAVVPAKYETAIDETAAHIQVRLPRADAQVWFQGGATTQTGLLREFVSPALTAGGTYTYTIQASWLDGGKERIEKQKVSVTPGARVLVDFAKLNEWRPMPPQEVEK